MKRLILSLALLLSTFVYADWTPGKEPVKAIIPFSPGGGTDLAFRHFQKYAEEQGITVVPVYKGGAEGYIGMTELAESKPDGRTIFFGTVTTAAVYIAKHPDYQLNYVSVIRGSIMAMATHPKSGIENLDDLESAVRNTATKKTFAYGSPNQRSFIEQYLSLAKATATPTLVPYKGAGPAVQDLLGGHVDVVVVPISVIKTQLDSGKLKLLAVTIRHPWKEVASWPNLNKKYPSWQNDDGFLLALPQGVNRDTETFWKNFTNRYMNDSQVKQDFYRELTEPEEFSPTVAQKRVTQAAKTITK